MRRIVCVLALALTACGGQASEDVPAQATPTPTPTPTPTTTVSARATATSNGARSVSEETDDFLFEYSYPKEAGALPELVVLLDRRLDRARTELARDSVEAREGAREDGFPYNKHSLMVEWKVVADLPDWLSLSAEVASYTGGAHGNYGFESLVWDKQNKRALKGIDLFESADALDEALGDRLCEALNKERAKRREEPVPEDSQDQFDRCVSVEEATVLAGSAGGRKFDRVGIQLGPYVAGPYVEGAYEFTFPVTQAVLTAVKPEFREAFAARN